MPRTLLYQASAFPSASAVTDTDEFSSTSALPPENVKNEHLWPTSFAHDSSSVAVPDSDVFAETSALPLATRRDEHLWPTSFGHDIGTDIFDGSFFDTVPLPLRTVDLSAFMRPGVSDVTTGPIVLDGESYFDCGLLVMRTLAPIYQFEFTAALGGPDSYYCTLSVVPTWSCSLDVVPTYSCALRTLPGS